ncbi:DUF3561 family protein [Brenneria izbisi]|uniref:DUF3561 family protein n=1 Tax=Brenneria izbisi TaxID=2939450 RepID=A0AA41XX18_9GAMM|nr:DUF3561 family protein [Brenneria izbisi]MCV9878550.1 DUF3561 family protein [Brenneria izbisi]MCV9881973.1 DUF3561 family protein [Brenneria izbisi]
MPNASQLTISKTKSLRDDEEYVTHPFMGAVAGFSFYWLAFTLPFLVYGSNATFFFMLYTWPFFLALMPLSILMGVGFSYALDGSAFYTLFATGLSVVCLFWLLFSFLSGW